MFIAFRQHKRNKGQSTLEYAVLIVVIIGALLAVRQYLQRGIMGRAKQAADDISDTQFDPELTTYVKQTNTYSRTNEVTNQEQVFSDLLEPETTNTRMNLFLENLP